MTQTKNDGAGASTSTAPGNNAPPASAAPGNNVPVPPRNGGIMLTASRKLTLLLALPALALLLPLFIVPFFGRRRY
jgi:hypothetical protein